MKALKIKKTQDNAVVPKRATDGSAGMDLSACLDEPYLLKAHAMGSIPTGIAIALPDSGHVALVFARSGLAVKHGVTLSNAVGVIDSDYRGEIRVGLINLSDKDYIIQPGERVAQLAVLPVCCLPVELCDELDETGRAGGGFGSTGRL